MKCKKYNQIKCGFEFDGNCIFDSLVFLSALVMVTIVVML